MRKFGLVFINIFFIGLGGNLFAVEVDEMLSNAVLEQRARDLSGQILCPTCPGQTIEDSGAGIARYLRKDIRQKLLEGLTDKEIIYSVAEKYGQQVLLNPTFQPVTYLLWYAPFIVAILSFVFAWYILRLNRKHQS